MADPQAVEAHRKACANRLATTVLEWLALPDAAKRPALEAYKLEHGQERLDEVLRWVKGIKEGKIHRSKIERLLI
jgi:hypothetical protein